MTDDAEWVVAKEWMLAATALRRRALMLESLLPCASAPPEEVLRLVSRVQACARGMADRARAAERRRLRALFFRWTIFADRMRAAVLVKRFVVREYYATLIQRTYRRHVARWTRPNVMELLRRVRWLEHKRSAPRKKGWRARSFAHKACQTPRNLCSDTVNTTQP